MDVEGLELENLNPLGNEKRKRILVGIFAIIVLVGTVVMVLNLGQPHPLHAYFTDDKIRSGTETTLIIEFHNLGNKDLRNVLFQITPENQNILINKTTHTESIIGAGAYRRIEIPVEVTGTLTQGSYKISVVVDAGEQEYEQNVYLEITG